MSWKHELDNWLTTPPEEVNQPEIKECLCGAIIHEGEDYYIFDGEIYCPECLDEYLNDHKYKVGDD